MRTGIQTIPNPGVASAEEYQRVYEARYLNDNLTVPVGWMVLPVLIGGMSW